MTSKEKCTLVCRILSSKKAGDIVYIDVAEKTSLCDYFIVCSGRSTTQVKSMAENDEEAFRIAAESAFHLHYCDHPDRDFDRWFSGLVESMESHAQKAHRHMSI